MRFAATRSAATVTRQRKRLPSLRRLMYVLGMFAPHVVREGRWTGLAKQATPTRECEPRARHARVSVEGISRGVLLAAVRYSLGRKTDSCGI